MAVIIEIPEPFLGKTELASLSVLSPLHTLLLFIVLAREIQTLRNNYYRESRENVGSHQEGVH